MTEEQFLVGKIVGFRGLAGEMKVLPSSNNPSLLVDIEDVEVRPVRGASFKAEVETIEIDKRVIFLTLQGFPDRTSVEKLAGAKIFTQRDQLQALEEDEWWSRDLIGLDVFTTEGEKVGTVCDVVGESGEFLEIRKSDRAHDDTILVPFVKPLVPVVNIAQRRIEVVNLPGLLD